MRTVLAFVAAVVVLGGCGSAPSPGSSPDLSLPPDASALDLAVVNPCGFEQTCVQFLNPSCQDYCGCPLTPGSNTNCQPPFVCATNNGMCDMGR